MTSEPLNITEEIKQAGAMLVARLYIQDVFAAKPDNSGNVELPGRLEVWREDATYFAEEESPDMPLDIHDSSATIFVSYKRLKVLTH